MNNKDNKPSVLFNNKYEQVRLLGEGSFGKAFLVESIEDKVNLYKNKILIIKRCKFIFIRKDFLFIVINTF